MAFRAGYTEQGEGVVGSMLHKQVILGMVLIVTAVSCTERELIPLTPLTPITPIALTQAVPSPTISPPLTPAPGISALVYDKLDPFFREQFEQLTDYEQLILDLCFEHPPDERVLWAIETRVIEVRWMGPVANVIKLPCWAVRVRLKPQSLSTIASVEGLYKLVLVEPAPNGDYVSKLDGTVRTLAKYRENSAKLAVFVHVKEKMSQTRIGELEQLGLTLFPETWIPPQGSNSTGFYLGEMQVSNIVQLARLSDIVRITSAEVEMKPSPAEEAIPRG